MSFKQNDNTPGNIHLGNYEEFFILYMDGELDQQGKKLVDEFLLQHPDLQAEFQMLLATRLPMEEFSFNKEDLFADAMKSNMVDEDLLLFIDNELPAEKRKSVELKISTNTDYRKQHELMLMTRLDASEKILFPDKNLLYRKEEKRTIIFRPWMRVAAAAVAIAAMGIVYFASENINSGNAPDVAEVKPQVKTDVKKQGKEKPEVEPKIVIPVKETTKEEYIADKGTPVKKDIDKLDLPDDVKTNIKKDDQHIEELIAVVDEPSKATKTAIIENGSMSGAVAINAASANSEIVNNHPVTSFLANRKTDESAAEKGHERDVAKGSVKGFLRKATRLIEKTTGIDPTNDGELLIGAIAINLK